MEITKQVSGHTEIIRIKGRIDAYWADQLGASLEASVGLGFRHVRLNLAGVDYLSSAGIRVILKYFKHFNGAGGTLTVIEPSADALSILELSGLANLVLPEAAAEEDLEEDQDTPRLLAKPNANFHAFNVEPDGWLKCDLVGSLSRIDSGEFEETDCRSVTSPAGTFSLGFGAFGGDYHDCRDRFGEFLAVAGVTAYQPSDGARVPDYIISNGDLVPEIKALYALQAQGPFTHRVHFEARPEPPGVVGLSEIVDTLFEINYADLLGVVMIAEAAGVVGATLKRESVLANESQPADGTAAENGGLSFRVERSSDRSLCIITGVACRRELASFASVLGSFGPNPLPVGHFHAALFPYQSLPWDDIDLFTVVNACFGSESAAGLLHLQADVRNPDDFAETELLRGACWIGKIKEIAVPRES